ncbi:hypothetical protein RUM43_006044 [Polyplax serrata]|uniref:CCR4-NOT transcription complex subunit 3 n=1 Tax=Polyplax serrata TaxID=468196 RepID=A0AAN8PC19_POLSC
MSCCEIERCLKKVTEGVEVFEDTWEKVRNAANSNQKEKYEADLKKEIKKLQRLRDQIKSWIASGEIKDKSSLLEYRKLIETQMERFKIVERETKTKAYSKEGLGAAQKLDPAQKERDDIREWLVSSIDSLNYQVDQFESEIESLVAGKKKRLDKEKQDRMDELRGKLEKHRYHIRKLETLLRMLHNMSVEVNKIKDIKDDVEYYIDSSEEPDFKENEFIYDDIIGLDEVELSGAALGGSADSNDTGGTPTSTVSDPSPVPSPPAPPPLLHNHSSDSSNDDKKKKDEVTPAKVLKPTALRAVVNNSVTTLGKPVSSSTPTKFSATPNNSSPSSGLNHVPTGNFAAVAAANNNNNINSNAKSTSHSTENGTLPSINMPPSLLQMSMQHPPSSLPSAAHTPSNTSQPIAANLVNNTTDHHNNTTTNSSPASSVSSRTSPLPPAPSPQPSLPQVAQLNGPLPNKLVAEGMSSLKLMAQEAVEKSGIELPQETSDAHIPPLLGVAPLGPAPLLKEHQFQFQMLEAGFYHMPLPSDTERTRQYLPRNPIQTPSYYSQTPLPHSDTVEFFQRLSTETLFFIFYYMEGTKAQYLSAKALKKQSWRFHTKYMMWFQRHEEPKIINEEYEQGTYIYFDYEKWGQKKKEGFTFEYKYLEDRDLN